MQKGVMWDAKQVNCKSEAKVKAIGRTLWCTITNSDEGGLIDMNTLDFTQQSSKPNIVYVTMDIFLSLLLI